MKTAIAVLLYLGVITVQGFPGLFTGFRRGLEEKDKITNYQQCGGMGGSCPRSGDACRGPWPWATCGKSSKCAKKTEDYYMCEPAAKETSKAKNTTTTSIAKASSGGAKELSPWTQCGGSTGDCTKYGKTGCKDCPFPGTSCATGYVCYRVVEFYWQCGPQDQYSASKGKDCAATEAGAPAPGPAESGSLALGASRECEAPLEGMAIQGKRFKAIMMKKDDMNYERCCSYCQEEDQCTAFHLNYKSAKEVVCALFVEMIDTVEMENAVAGMLVGALSTATIAGR